MQSAAGLILALTCSQEGRFRSSKLELANSPAASCSFAWISLPALYDLRITREICVQPIGNVELLFLDAGVV